MKENEYIKSVQEIFFKIVYVFAHNKKKRARMNETKNKRDDFTFHTRNDDDQMVCGEDL